MTAKTPLVGALLGLALISLTGCGGDDRDEVDACVDHMERMLEEAGSDRELTLDEQMACRDPDQRAFIMGED